MKKHIERLENCSWGYFINNLEINKIGSFNIFCGTEENGYDYLKSVFYKQYGDLFDKCYVDFNENFLSENHYSQLKNAIKSYFTHIRREHKQIFATTQRLDVIQAFAEVAQEYKDVEAYYYRLGRSAIPSDNNRSIVSMYTTDELIEAISKNREVR